MEPRGRAREAESTELLSLRVVAKMLVGITVLSYRLYQLECIWIAELLAQTTTLNSPDYPGVGA